MGLLNSIVQMFVGRPSSTPHWDSVRKKIAKDRQLYANVRWVTKILPELDDDFMEFSYRMNAEWDKSSSEDNNSESYGPPSGFLTVSYAHNPPRVSPRRYWLGVQYYEAALENLFEFCAGERLPDHLRALHDSGKKFSATLDSFYQDFQKQYIKAIDEFQTDLKKKAPNSVHSIETRCQQFMNEEMQKVAAIEGIIKRIRAVDF